MSASSWQAVWLLAVEVAAVVGLTWVIAWRLRSVVWQRTLWQASLLALAGLLVVEFAALFPEQLQKETEAVGPVMEAKAEAGEVPPLVTELPVAATELSIAPVPPLELGPVVTEPVREVVEVKAETAEAGASSPIISSAQTKPGSGFPLALAIVLGVWVVGSLVLAGRLLVGRFLLLRFCARSQSVYDVRLFDRVQGIAGKLGLKQGVQVLETERIQTPVVFGLVRLTIALPVGFAEKFERRQQEAILAHELAHLAARDPLWYLLADALVSVLWWHPLVWVARARLQVTSEMAADEACVLAKHGPETLAECLVTIAQEMHGQGALESIGIEGSGFRSRLGQRVERLLKLSAEAVSRPAVWRTRLVKVGMPVLLLAVLLVGSGWVRRDQSAPWSGLMSGAWNMMAGVLKVEEADIKRDPRPILMAAANANTVVIPDPAPIPVPVSAKLSGKVKVQGQLPREAEVQIPENMKKHLITPITTRFYKVSSDWGLAYSVVYVKHGLEGKTTAAATEPVTIVAKGLQFQPYIAAAQTGQRIRFQMEDPVLHNLSFAPKNPKNKGWNKAMLPNTPVFETSIAHPERMARISSDTMPWAYVYLNVFEHPYFAVTDGEGRFEFAKPLPPGRYTLAVYHRQAGEAEMEVEVKGEGKPVEFMLEVGGAGKQTLKLKAETEKKLDELVLPELFMDGLPLEVALQYLMKESQRLDPEKKGLQMEWRGIVPAQNNGKGGVLRDPLGAPLQPVRGGEPGKVQELKDVTVMVNPVKKGLSFREVLEVVCAGAAVPLQYNIQNGVVVVTAKPNVRGTKKAEGEVQPQAETRLAMNGAPILVGKLELNEETEKKLDELILPELSIDGLPLAEALKYLMDESKRLDPQKKGLEFEQRQIVSGKVKIEVGADGNTIWADRGGKITNRVENVVVTVKPGRKGLSMRQALEAICSGASLPTRFTNQNGAVVVSVMLNEAGTKVAVNGAPILAKKAEGKPEVTATLEPLVSQIFTLKYAVPTEIVTAVGTAITDSRGKIVADDRAKKLLVTVVQGDLKPVEDIVRRMDVARDEGAKSKKAANLDAIKLPQMSLRNVTLGDAVSRLNQVLQNGPDKGVTLDWGSRMKTAIGEINLNLVTCSAEIREGASLREALELICKGAVYALEYQEKGDRVVFQPRQPEVAKADPAKGGKLEAVQQVKLEKVEISKLVSDAKQLYEQNRLGAAEDKLKEALKHDPANSAAFYYLNLINETRYGDLARTRDAEQRARITQVEKAWEIPTGTNRLAVPNPYGQTNTIRSKMPLRNVILAKLDEMVIKELYFDGVPLTEVVRFLQEESLRQDPEKKGVRFIINSNLDDQPGSGGRTNSAVVDLEKAMITINPPLKNLRMVDAINAITLAAKGAGEHGLGFMVEDYAVVFRQRVIDPPQLFTRIFKVDKDKLIQGLEKQAGVKMMPLATNLTAVGTSSFPPSSAATNQGVQVTGYSVARSREFAHLAQQFFAACGVDMSTNRPGQASTQIFFNDRTGVLMARASLRDLELIAHGLEALGAVVDNAPIRSGISSAGSSVVRFYKFEVAAYVRGLERVTGKKVAEMSAAPLAAQVNVGKGINITNSYHMQWQQIYLLTMEFLKSQGADLLPGNFAMISPQDPEDAQEVSWTVRGSAEEEDVFRRSSQRIVEAGKQDGEVVPLGRATNQVAIKPAAESVNRFIKFEIVPYVRGLEKLTEKKVDELAAAELAKLADPAERQNVTNRHHARWKQIFILSKEFLTSEGADMTSGSIKPIYPKEAEALEARWLVSASAANLEVIQKVIEKIMEAGKDTGAAVTREPRVSTATGASKPVNPTRPIANDVPIVLKQSFKLRHETPTNIVRVIRGAFTSTQSTAIADTPNNMLLVNAPEQDMKRVEEIIRKLDVAANGVTSSGATQPLLVKEETDERITKVFKVDADSSMNGFREMMKTSGFASTNLQEMMREFIRKSGVNLSEGNTNGTVVFLNDRTGVLLARARPAEMQIIESAIEVLNIIPPQVQIQANYLVIPEKVAEEMGLKWFANGLPPDMSKPVAAMQLAPAGSSNRFNIQIDAPQVPNHVSILSPEQARELLKRLGDADGVDRLSAPRVTTVNKRQAQISVMEAMTVVVGRTNRVVKGEAGKKDSEEPVFITEQFAMGPMLDVIPNVYPDGKSMRLDWVFSLTEFVGYEKPEKIGELPTPQARRRQVANQNVIQDGYTLVAGCGMADIKTEAKKGLFRSGREKTEKKMVLILMKVNLLDPAGNYVNRE